MDGVGLVEDDNAITVQDDVCPSGNAVFFQENAQGEGEASMGPEIRQQPGVFDLDGFGPGIFAWHAVYADACGDRAEILECLMVRLQRTHLL